MQTESIILVFLGLLAYALISKKLNGSMISAPMIFVAFGYLLGTGGMDIVDVGTDYSVIHFIAEVTLVLVLFTDAGRIDLKGVRQDHNLPVRMLSMGLPLTILIGASFALVLFPELLLWEAALLAALLAPTDAALGQAVVSDKAVPIRVRQAINIESGLNDGIALPAVLLFAALASAGMQQATSDATHWFAFFALQVILGPIVGIVVGYCGAKLIDYCGSKAWMTPAFQGIAILSLAALTYLLAEVVGGNGFIAAFIGGMIFGNASQSDDEFLFEFMETEGQLFMLVTFLIFGATLLPEGLSQVTSSQVLYAVLSLTVIRMLPIAFSLLGSGVRSVTVLFLGWFGPRGLASILFVLLILENTEIPHRQDLLTITVLTVMLSIVLHGLTAGPFSKWYGKHADTMGDCEETLEVMDMPLRNGSMSIDQK